MVNIKFKIALLPLAVILASADAISASNAELEERILVQEKKIKTMERRVKSTRNVVKQNRSRLSDMSNRLKINGFFSSGVSSLDSDDYTFDLLDIDDKYSTSSVAKLGIQMTFKVSDTVNVTGQLVAKGTEDYNVEGEWAYLSWQVSDNFMTRVGRQRTPYYMLSEYVDVGYAYPWSRPPIEMYKLPLNNMDGLSLLYNFNIDEWKIGTHAYIGEGFGEVEFLEGSFSLQNQGVALTAEYGSWLFFLGYSNSKIDVEDIKPGGAFEDLLSGINDPVTGLKVQIDNVQGFSDIAPIDMLPTKGFDSTYMSAAFTYDNGNLLVMGEYANLEVEDFVLPAGDGGYLLVGYRFGKWMPHITYSKYYTDEKNDEQIRAYIDGAKDFSEFSGSSAFLALANNLEPLIQEQTSVTLGVVYDLNARTKVKFDMSRYSSFGENSFYTLDGGNVVSSENNGFGIFGLSEDAKEDPSDIDSSTTIYTLSIDSVF